ncbi:MAG: Prolipoprotein diacylglyceryl transferase [uncultured Cytophagales bacterium]|uniref:Phosphatidylglycerol--prolipoprotein diacylglyceryl transferase n=1 Tax=uncultured Cytophagales bacterium TaxID=158755 RepID=A0A6J4JVH3_9SPHI|nr:MAG: Prolipoprotein diacylglyceryl transferase [uncultured Cytophagales bacterium]
MLSFLQYITWDVSPEIFDTEYFSVRWYGLLFALGFLLGQQILIYIFKKEGKPESDVEVLTVYMVLSTIIGARLGHCFFYEWDYYSQNPIKILKIWEGGLASHGATIGILFALWLYARKKKDQSYLWIVDRIVITVALAGCLIRLGNLMNSEIIGKPTDVPWAFVFTSVDKVPRHPAQLYEAITCFILFGFLFWLWNRRKAKTPEGSLLGIFLIYIFGLRFVYEFLKENQVKFEDELALNMGQILSIPAVLGGIFVLLIANRNARKRDALDVAQGAVSSNQSAVSNRR